MARRRTQEETQPPKTRGRRQPELAGLEQPRDKEVDAAAETYVSTLYDRMDLQRQEAKAHDALLALMQSRRLKSYTYRDGEYEYPIVRKAKEAKERLRTKRKEILIGGGDDEEEQGDDE